MISVFFPLEKEKNDPRNDFSLERVLEQMSRTRTPVSRRANSWHNLRVFCRRSVSAITDASTEGHGRPMVAQRRKSSANRRREIRGRGRHPHTLLRKGKRRERGVDPRRRLRLQRRSRLQRGLGAQLRRLGAVVPRLRPGQARTGADGQPAHGCRLHHGRDHSPRHRFRRNPRPWRRACRGPLPRRLCGGPHDPRAAGPGEVLHPGGHQHAGARLRAQPHRIRRHPRAAALTGKPAMGVGALLLQRRPRHRRLARRGHRDGAVAEVPGERGEDDHPGSAKEPVPDPALDGEGGDPGLDPGAGHGEADAAGMGL